MKKFLLFISGILFSASLFSQVSVLSQTNPSCPGMCNGAVTLSITGGTMPYTINTFGGPSSCTIMPVTNVNSNTVTISGLCSCLYNFFVQDATFTPIGGIPVTIISPPPINITFSVQNVCCNGLCNGAVYAFVFGGTSPYNYNWSTAATGSAVTNLCQGNYFLSVTDANGCMQTASTTVTAPPPFNLSTSVAATSCSSCCNGTITVSGNGGQAPYSYTIFPGSTSNSSGTFSNLCAGTYSICGSDNGCCMTCIGVTVPTGSATSTGNVNFKEDDVTIFPNPSNGSLNIHSWTNMNGGTYEIFDVLGKKLDSGKAEDILKMTPLKENGVYFVILRNKEGTVISRKKIVVEK